MNAKKLRTHIVNQLFNWLDAIRIPNHILAFMIKSGHLHFPIYSLIFFILLPLPLAFLQLFISIVSLSLYIYFDGCILTILEYKLNNNKDDIHIIDGLLYLLEYDITNDNRINVTLIVAGYYFIIVMLILWIRYNIYKYKKKLI